MSEYIAWFNAIGMDDVARVGGKNASLGEMISNLSGAGIDVPNGFATTASAYQQFLTSGDITGQIDKLLSNLDIDDIEQLAVRGKQIRQTILETPLPDNLSAQVVTAYRSLRDEHGGASVAVRSSATAEDLPEASFAGQQETYLNVTGDGAVLSAVHKVFASLFNDRAIAYRIHHGFDHADVALSAGVQRMVRSDRGASGVIFTIDTESGFSDAVFITASWGLGECIVQGAVNPDEFYVYKPALESGGRAILRRSRGRKAIKMVYSDDPRPEQSVRTVDVDVTDQHCFSINDDDVIALAKMAVTIERHYGRPMDIEWGKDGESGKLFILQARPETVESRDSGRVLERYKLHQSGTVLTEGRSIGQRIGSGAAKVIATVEHIDQVLPGDVLVTDMTDPDWEPVMKRASAIVTNRGGRTCHAAIIARELGVPAVVGCQDATHAVTNGQPVTVSCAEGDTGYVYAGELPHDVERIDLDRMPQLPFKIAMNVANPERAFGFSRIPNHGVGLARLEFVISNTIGVHPRALLDYDNLPDAIRRKVDDRIAGYPDPVTFYVEKLVEGIGTIAAAFAPKPVIVRMSDFKSNEYANLLGGELFEPDEENPMLGFRGACRYLDATFESCFELECRALKIVREELGLSNLRIMVPFVRTLDEASQVVDLLANNGLRRGENDLQVIMMCEIPSNALLAEQFLEHFDGFSIGSNDLTQLCLGVDRDSGIVASNFDERNPAVKVLLHQAIQACRRANKYVGICGQGPSDYPDFARWLMEEGIESVSLNPDTVVETWLYLAGEEVA